MSATSLGRIPDTSTDLQQGRPSGQSKRTRPARTNLFGARINLFYVPALILLGVFTGYPLIRGIQLSLYNWDGFSPSMTFTGIDNYARLLSDSTFLTALTNTLIYAFGSTLIQQVLGLALAVILDRAIRGRSVARAIIYLPVLVSPVIMGTMYYMLLSYNTGTLNDIVVALGGERTAWLADAGVATAVIVLVNALQFVGISMIIYLAGLQSIDPSYQEAAMLDGAGGWRQFVNITLPLLQPAFATSVVLNLIGGFQLFDAVVVMTGGGPGNSTNSLSTLIARTYFGSQSAGYAAAIGVALFLMIIIITAALNKLLNRQRLEA